MKKRSLISQVFPSYLLVAVVAIVAVASYASIIISRFYHAHSKDELVSAARMSAEHFKTVIARGKDGQPGTIDGNSIDAFCKASGKGAGYRLTFILQSGKVMGDSEDNPENMENHGDRPEVHDAIVKGIGISTRYSHTLGMKMMYVAVAVEGDFGQTIGVVRTSLSLSVIDKTIGLLWHRIVIACLVIACIAAIISIVVSRRISRPLEEIRLGAESIGKGNLNDKIPPSGLAEIDVLADTINHMADQLNERINTVTQQRDEQNALLSCMIESVFAVDTEKCLIKMNNSAQKLFKADASVYGRNVMEVIRNNDLLDVVNRALDSSEPVEGDISIPADGRYLHAHGTVLNGADGRRIGALIVLYDVTRLRKLEEMRRDFVANVSHELKTPITSIKGFVETLLEGAMKEPAEAENFLRITLRQADRLNAIIKDLLILSSVEQESEMRTISLQKESLRKVLQEAIEVCSHKARGKKIEIRLDCDDQLTAMINPALLEQAIVNLIDNAVKYSGEGASVEVEAKKTDNRIVIQVRDHGSGMEKVHLTRIFERFYRVDKGRSRQLGGTGLGLSIVKHIALAHGGDVGVESTPGVGSTFFIYLEDLLPKSKKYVQQDASPSADGSA
ncbi:MAG: ATP-binding protein [Kiritimatiellae bacterium]|nr:ATP-binding protein [Kiritimatiellia bacterium]MDD5521634.1 ATP-binding protein [Kiritimatiellia bacterium]